MIYKITNKINGDFYIGWTEVGLARRWTVHKCNSRTGETYLYRAMRKYGTENFKIEELCEGSQDQEIKMIAELSPPYNMTAGGDGGDTSSSPNFKRAIKEVHAKRTPQDYATYGMLGKKFPESGKKKVSLANGQKIKIDGVLYNSIREASEKTEWTHKQIRRRLDSDKYASFVRISEKVRRK